MARAAATYFVLGKADDENFAKAEHLAETLMSALPSGAMPTSSATLPTCPAGLTWGVSVAVTCHIVPTLPEAWPALCKTTCARYVRPRCDAPHPLPPRCRLRVHWRAGWEASRQQPRATSHRPSLPPSVHQSMRRLSLRPCVPAGSGVKRRILSCGRGRASLSVTLSTLKAPRPKCRVRLGAEACPPPAALDAGLRAWADPCTLAARPDPSDS